MLITRGAKPERDFTIVSNALLRDESLSFRARGVLCCILSHAEGFRVSSDRLAGKEGRDAIRSALKELEAAGYLLRTKSQDEKGHWISSAVVSDVPEFLGQSAPKPESPATGSQASDNRASVSPALIEDQEEEKKKKKEAPKPSLPKIAFEEGQFQHVTDTQQATWAAAYPAVSVQAEVLKAAAWLDANPANKKSDYKRFLNGWLSRAQDKAPRAQLAGHAQTRQQYAAPRRTPAPENFAARTYVGGKL